jgi:hypothetical protein
MKHSNTILGLALFTASIALNQYAIAITLGIILAAVIADGLREPEEISKY